MQVRSNLDKLCTLYLDWRAVFQVLSVSFDTDTLTKDTLYGSLDTEAVSWIWFADPHVLYQAQP